MPQPCRQNHLCSGFRLSFIFEQALKCQTDESRHFFFPSHDYIYEFMQNAKRSSEGGAISDSSVSGRPVQTGFHYVTLSIIHLSEVAPSCLFPCVSRSNASRLRHETDLRCNRLHDENSLRSVRRRLIYAHAWPHTGRVTHMAEARFELGEMRVVVMVGVCMRANEWPTLSYYARPFEGGTVICVAVISCSDDFTKEC